MNDLETERIHLKEDPTLGIVRSIVTCKMVALVTKYTVPTYVCPPEKTVSLSPNLI